MPEVKQCAYSPISPSIRSIHQRHEVRYVVVIGGVAKLLEQATLYLDCDSLQRDYRNVIAFLESLPKSLYTSTLLSLYFFRRMIDRFFEQSWRLQSSLFRPLLLDLLNDPATILIGAYY